MLIGFFKGYLDFMAKMGLTSRGDPPKVIDMAGREWGEPVDGLALSIREIPKEDPGELPAISVVIRNAAAAPRTLEAAGLHFYRIGIDTPPTPWGKQALSPARRAASAPVTLGPGDATETNLPLGQLYEMRRGRDYRVTVTSESGLRSNEIVIRP